LAKTGKSFEALEAEYQQLWDRCELVSSKKSAAQATAKRILAARERYEAVSEQTNVPWFVIGLIHAMECGLNFKQHLHNGDPLTARTWQVPKGRPTEGEPPFTWEASATDALRYDGLDKVESWDPPRLCYELEKYNGFGYRNNHPEVKTPYLWSGTNNYTRGKYVADGKWSSTAVSGQSGAIAILRCLMEIEDDVAIALDAGHHEAPEHEDHEVTEAPVPTKTMAESKTGNASIAVGGLTGLQSYSTMVKAGTAAVKTAPTAGAAILALMADQEFMLAAATLVVGVAGAMFIWWDRREKMRKHGI